MTSSSMVKKAPKKHNIQRGELRDNFDINYILIRKHIKIPRELQLLLPLLRSNP
jgi:hypothetical protein